MTDTLQGGSSPVRWGSVAQRRHTEKRHAADRRLQLYGKAAIGFAIALLAVLIGSLVTSGYTAFVQTKVLLEVFADPKLVAPDNIARGNFRRITQRAVADLLPDVKGARDRRAANKMLTSAAQYIIRDHVIANPDLISKRFTIPVAFSDPYDQLHKNVIPAYIDVLTGREKADFETLTKRGVIHTANGEVSVGIDAYLDPARIDAADLENGKYLEIVEEGLRSYYPQDYSTGYLRILSPQAQETLKRHVEVNPGDIGKTVRLRVPVSEHYATLAKGKTPKIINPRFASQKELGWYQSLVERGLVKTVFATELFVNADSRFPEQAGLAGAIFGSALALLVCFLISFPVGIASALYLEEFAPQNRVTDFLEVNINNLAAVPSVVFGLLGLAVFLGTFGLPRSAPLVGGMVLSLMTLPTIIITTRAALKAVPPSIREAAYGIGASRHEVMLHHVIPLALPGILTGTIIGLAQALGETAPLLLIGMNAFIPSVENIGLMEPGTSLPTQIFSWADSPERGFVARTSAAILVLLTFLVTMNAVAIYLRKQFERRW